jgi:hypothetical protein
MVVAGHRGWGWPHPPGRRGGGAGGLARRLGAGVGAIEHSPWVARGHDGSSLVQHASACSPQAALDVSLDGYVAGPNQSMETRSARAAVESWQMTRLTSAPPS